MRQIDADAFEKVIRNKLPLGLFMKRTIPSAMKAMGELVEELERAPTIDPWHYPSRGELPDKDWSKHPLNVSKECFVVTKRGIGTIAWWDNDYRTWFERPHLPVLEVIVWQYFVPPKKLYTY